jgi:uncharacterized membrane protein
MVNRLLVAAAMMAAAATSIGLGCGDSTGAGGGTDCATVTVKTYTQLEGAFAKCLTCHDSNLMTPTERQSATVGFDYETYELAKRFPVEIREQVEDDEMPPAGLPQLTPTEKADLLAWADCNTPGP